MTSEVRSKYRSFNTVGTNKSDATFSVFMLDTICNYVISENRNIKKSQLINLRSLMNMLDIEKNFASDPQKMEKIEFINKALEARLDYNLQDRGLILSHVLGMQVDPNTYGADTLNNDALNWVNETVAEALKDSFICESIGNLTNILTEFKQTEYRNRGPILNRLEVLIVDMNNKFRSARLEQHGEMMFSLKDGVFEDTVRELHTALVNPTNKLVTGMQGFNQMLSGGFESGRTYIIFGLPGEGKSATLLDIALQIKKYNISFKTKDPTKIPCVVVLTMENSVRECFERLFNMTVSADDVSNFDIEEVINGLRVKGGLKVTPNNPIDIIIQYVPGNSVTTEYLYTLTDNLEDQGYEVIMMIQDYLKRINSANIHNGTDVRLEYGAIVNEFKSYAIEKDVPLLTASQLNREATVKVDNGRSSSRADLVKLLGRGNIGESMLILENADAAFAIAPEYDGEEKDLGIQVLKTRYKKTGRQIIFQPYCEDLPLKLKEDLNTEPVFKETLTSTGKLNNGMIGSTGPTNINPAAISRMGYDIQQSKVESISDFISNNMVFDSSKTPEPEVAHKIINPFIYLN